MSHTAQRFFLATLALAWLTGAPALAYRIVPAEGEAPATANRRILRELGYELRYAGLDPRPLFRLYRALPAQAEATLTKLFTEASPRLHEVIVGSQEPWADGPRPTRFDRGALATILAEYLHFEYRLRIEGGADARALAFGRLLDALARQARARGVLESLFDAEGRPAAVEPGDGEALLRQYCLEEVCEFVAAYTVEAVALAQEILRFNLHPENFTASYLGRLGDALDHPGDDRLAKLLEASTPYPPGRLLVGGRVVAPRARIRLGARARAFLARHFLPLAIPGTTAALVARLNGIHGKVRKAVHARRQAWLAARQERASRYDPRDDGIFLKDQDLAPAASSPR